MVNRVTIPVLLAQSFFELLRLRAGVMRFRDATALPAGASGRGGLHDAFDENFERPGENDPRGFLKAGGVANAWGFVDIPLPTRRQPPE